MKYNGTHLSSTPPNPKERIASAMPRPSLMMKSPASALHLQQQVAGNLKFKSSKALVVNKPTGGSSWQRRLEAMEQQAGLASPEQSQSGLNRWLLPYADMLTLMLGLFLVLFTVTTEQNNQLRQQLQQATAANSIAAQPVQAMAINTTQKPLEQSLKASLSKLAALPVKPENKLAPSSNKDWQLGKTLQLRQTPRGLMLSLQDKLLFKAGEATLTPAAQQALKAIALPLSKVKGAIRIEGHTDNSPIHSALYPSNWELSTARATVLLRYLVEQGGLAPQQLTASGYGEYRPLAQNSTIGGKQKNRRVDILILSEAAGKNEPVQPWNVTFHQTREVAKQNVENPPSLSYSAGP
jgi:chemotaxis protein MotB